MSINTKRFHLRCLRRPIILIPNPTITQLWCGDISCMKVERYIILTLISNLRHIRSWGSAFKIRGTPPILCVQPN